MASEMKQGFLERKEGLIMTSWIKRWCFLQGHELQIFASAAETKPLTVLSLSEVSQVIPSTKPGEESVFEIYADPSSRATVFKASTMTELSQWINALVQASLISTMVASDHHPPPASTPNEKVFSISRPLGLSQHFRAISTQPRFLVFAIKGMMLNEHADRVEAATIETPGIVRFKLDFNEELLHLEGAFDEQILKNNLERLGFLVYYEPEIPCVFSNS